MNSLPCHDDEVSVAADGAHTIRPPTYLLSTCVASCASLAPEQPGLAPHLARRALVERIAAANNNGSTLLLQLGLVELAVVSAARRVAGAPAPPTPPRSYRRWHPKVARILDTISASQQTGELAGELEESLAIAPAAAEALRASLALAPDCCRAHHALGSALLPRTGDYSASAAHRRLATAAESQYRRAAQLVPTSALLHMKAATVALRARLRPDAEIADSFAAAVAAAPMSAAASQHLVTALQWAGQHAAAAREARRGVAAGLWQHVLQRPAKHTAGLRATPFWTPARVAPGVCRVLREADAALRADLVALKGSVGGCAPQDEGLHAANTTWRVCDVLRRCDSEGAHGVDRSCRVLLHWERESGVALRSAQFSLLDGGGHIRPHTGVSNGRLVLHYTLRLPTEPPPRAHPAPAMLRVGSTWRAFEPGRCIAFDDSYEHEVVHPGAQERATLVLQVGHPHAAGGAGRREARGG